MKLLRHLAGYLPVQVANGIAAFGGVFVYTRLLGPDEYGRYALMFSAMALIHMLSLTSAEAAAFRFAGEADAKALQSVARDDPSIFSWWPRFNGVCDHRYWFI